MARGINAKSFEVVQARWSAAIRADAGVDNNPVSLSGMCNNAFSKSGPEKGNLHLVSFRRRCWLAQDQEKKVVYLPLPWPSQHQLVTTKVVSESELLRRGSAVRGNLADTR